LFIGLTRRGKAILLDTFYYSPVNQVRKKAPSEFSKSLWDFVQMNSKKWKVPIDTWTIDSAEGALRNQVFKDYGLLLMPARKKQKIKMIENVEDMLAQGKAYVLRTKNNEVFLDEHKKYRWDEKTLLTAEPKVIKEYDHTCDGYQYYVNNNLDKLGLKL
jgi:phage terminase large subunit